MFDSQRAFGMQIPHLAQSSPALMYAVLALSARQKERQNALVPPSLAQAGLREQEAPPASFDSLELYQEAIRLITPLMQTHDPAVIPICVILCCLEMMSASAHDWRRHLEGCAALFDAFGLHGFSGGLMQAIFWCFARMGAFFQRRHLPHPPHGRLSDQDSPMFTDLCGALISDGTESTMVAPATWLPPGAHETDARSLFREAGSADMHANYAVYLCSKACELLSDRTQFLEMDEQNGCTTEVFASRWARLWHDLQVWLDQRPAEMLPVQTNDTKPFPQILYIHWAAISSNQLYHAACILLLSSMPRTTIKDPPRGLVGSTAWHAKQICGISLTNPHQGCLNNAIQPLWLAGRLLSHESEHAAVVELIQSIESETGWGACWRIPDLEAAWGYAASRYTRPPANKAWE